MTAHLSQPVATAAHPAAPAAVPTPDPAMEAARARLGAVIETMDLLTGLFAEEEAAIAARDVDALKALADRKQALGRAYDEALRALRLDTEAQAALDEGSKAAFRERAAAFQAAVEANAGLLKVQSEVSQKVVDAIVTAINHQRLQETGYGPARPGARTGGGYRSPVATPATLNKTF